MSRNYTQLLGVKRLCRHCPGKFLMLPALHDKVLYVMSCGHGSRSTLAILSTPLMICSTQDMHDTLHMSHMPVYRHTSYRLVSAIHHVQTSCHDISPMSSAHVMSSGHGGRSTLAILSTPLMICSTQDMHDTLHMSYALAMSSAHAHGSTQDMCYVTRCEGKHTTI